MTTTQRNKEIVTAAMDALASGDQSLFYAAFADDVIWRAMPTQGPWAHVLQGKERARDELFAPLRKQYADRYTNTATHIFAEGDHVVVECKGAVMLKSGKRYDNQYCFVIRMEDGQMKEVREYLDSALAEAVLEPL